MIYLPIESLHFSTSSISWTPDFILYQGLEHGPQLYFLPELEHGPQLYFLLEPEHGPQILSYTKD